MMLRTLVPIATILACGCKVVDAPDDLEDLAVFGFVHFDDGDAFREETADALTLSVDDNLVELREGYRVDSLTGEDLEGAGVEAPEPRELIGVATVIEMATSLDEVLEILCGDDIAENFASTLEYTVHDSTDLDCFLTRTCESYAFDATRMNDLGLMGTSEQDFSMTLRWVDLADGREGVLIRQLSPEEVDMSSSLVRLHQNYIFDFLEPTENGGTRRFEANWVDVEILGIDIPDSLALDLAVSSLQRRGEEIDALTGASGPP